MLIFLTNLKDQKQHENVRSMYLIKNNNASSKEPYIFIGGYIPKNDAEFLLDDDDVFYGTNGYHEIENYKELRKHAPEWESCQEYLDRLLEENKDTNKTD